MVTTSSSDMKLPGRQRQNLFTLPTFLLRRWRGGGVRSPQSGLEIGGATSFFADSLFFAGCSSGGSLDVKLDSRRSVTIDDLPHRPPPVVLTLDKWSSIKHLYQTLVLYQ